MFLLNPSRPVRIRIQDVCHGGQVASRLQFYRKRNSAFLSISREKTHWKQKSSAGAELFEAIYRARVKPRPQGRCRQCTGKFTPSQIKFEASMPNGLPQCPLPVIPIRKYFQFAANLREITCDFALGKQKKFFVI